MLHRRYSPWDYLTLADIPSAERWRPRLHAPLGGSGPGMRLYRAVLAVGWLSTILLFAAMLAVIYLRDPGSPVYMALILPLIVGLGALTWIMEYPLPLRGRIARARVIRSLVAVGASGDSQAVVRRSFELRNARAAWRRRCGGFGFSSGFTSDPLAFGVWTTAMAMLMLGPYLTQRSGLPLSGRVADLMPFLMLAALLVSLSLAGRKRQALRRAIDCRACPHCHYDLAALGPSDKLPEPLATEAGPERCPECGLHWPLVPPPAPLSA